MNPRLKLWVRRRALMMLRAIVWHADEWLHRQELALREYSASVDGKSSLARNAIDFHKTLGSRETAPVAGPVNRAIRPATVRETFLQWEARKSGVVPIVKAHRRRCMTAAQFDARFAR
jgi:hypothetical protein